MSKYAVRVRRSNPLRSLTRLAVGGVLLGLDAILERLPEWEEKAEARFEPAQALAEVIETAPKSRGEERAAFSGSEADSLTRHALLGLLFELQARFQERPRPVRYAARLGWGLARSLDVFGLSAPIQRGFDKLVDRGEREVSRWVKAGHEEERRSRALARAALEGSVDAVLGNVAHNPDVRELVLTQGSGMADEAIEEVRERTVSADMLLDGIIRRLLRRPPPEAPPKQFTLSPKRRRAP